MKTYRSHKLVKAAKIAKVIRSAAKADGIVLETEDSKQRWFPQDQQRFADAGVGEYLVEYEDGYCSVSPADAFEAGYTEVTK